MEGTLVFHDSIRKWFELRLDQPTCGQGSIELVPGKHSHAPGGWTQVEVYRGCRVRTRGAIAFSPTGYYSLDTAQAVEEIDQLIAQARANDGT